MDIKDRPYTDNLLKKVDEIQLSDTVSLARALALYIKILNDNSVVNSVSISYIENYDGRSFNRRFKKYFEQMLAMFTRNELNDNDRRTIFRRVAKRCCRIPTNVTEMKHTSQVVIEEAHIWLKVKRSLDARKLLIKRFKFAIKKYMQLAYSLGFNEPSMCVKTLAAQHRLDKYILSGDFQVMLLPFLPEVEDVIQKSYENYDMKDAWDVIQGRYFNHKEQYMTLAIEIKANFTKNIVNFSDYFDKIYTDTYYRMMLGKKPKK